MLLFSSYVISPKERHTIPLYSYTLQALFIRNGQSYKNFLPLYFFFFASVSERFLFIIIAFDKDVEEEHLIATCERFAKFSNVSYIFDKWNLLDEKDSPVDKGYKRWKFLYEHRVHYNKTK